MSFLRTAERNGLSRENESQSFDEESVNAGRILPVLSRRERRTIADIDSKRAKAAAAARNAVTGPFVAVKGPAGKGHRNAARVPIISTTAMLGRRCISAPFHAPAYTLSALIKVNPNVRKELPADNRKIARNEYESARQENSS